MLQRQCSLLAAVSKRCKLLGMHLQMAQYLEWHVALLRMVCKVCKSKLRTADVVGVAPVCLAICN